MGSLQVARCTVPCFRFFVKFIFWCFGLIWFDRFLSNALQKTPNTGARVHTDHMDRHALNLEMTEMACDLDCQASHCEAWNPS